MNKTAFLFGAGAEHVFDLPSGEVFLRETLFAQNNAMLGALKGFYKNNHSVWASNYSRNTLFSDGKDEHIMRILNKTLNRMGIKNNLNIPHGTKSNGENDINYKIKCDLEKHASSDALDKFKHIFSLAKKHDPISFGYIEEHKVIEKLTTFGFLENYFHTLIAPQIYGKDNVWKLINYYWACYFSIAGRIVNADDYISVLNDKSTLKEYVEKIKAATEENKNAAGSYYNPPLYKGLPEIAGIITTNYTTYVENVKAAKAAYINGRLDVFENPRTMQIGEISKLDFSNDDVIFPFLLTQSAVKPVISDYQIKELYKAAKILDESDTLIVIGYGINEDDNHLNSLIHKFIAEGKTKKLIYCDYQRSAKNCVTVADISQKLRLSENNNSKIHIIYNDGDAEKLFEKIAENLKGRF